MMFHHCVHFWLRDDLTDAQRRAFITGVKQIAESPNVQSIRVGTPAGTPRPVVDNSWSVQLLCIFPDKASHDRYQSADDAVHQRFIDTYKSNWTKVLIYDSLDA